MKTFKQFVRPLARKDNVNVKEPVLAGIGRKKEQPRKDNVNVKEPVLAGIGRKTGISESLADDKFIRTDKLEKPDLIDHHNDVHDCFEYVDTGTAGLRAYKSSSADINDALHQMAKGQPPASARHRLDHQDAHDDISRLHFLFQRTAPSKADTKVFTGVAHNIPQIFADHIDENGNVPEHVTIHHPAFMSTSSDFDVASLFAGHHKVPQNTMSQHEVRETDGISHMRSGRPDNSLVSKHVLQLHVPKGTSALSTTGGYKAKTEHEVLLDRGHKIKIHRNPSAHKGVTVWHAEVVGQEKPPIEDVKSYFKKHWPK